MARATAQIESAFADVARRCKDPREAYEGAAQSLGQSVDRNFEAEGRPKWERRKDKQQHPILKKTGALRKNMDLGSDSSAAFVEPGESYGAFHDAGTGSLPRREFLKAGEAELEELADEFATFVMEPMT